jgi:hypothetical protein
MYRQSACLVAIEGQLLHCYASMAKTGLTFDVSSDTVTA